MGRKPLPLRLAWIFAWMVTAALAALVAARLLAYDRWWPLLALNLFTPYLYIPAWVIGVLAVIARRWRLGALAIVVVIFHVQWTLVPLLPKQPPKGTGPSLRVVCANLLMNNANPQALADELEELQGDVYLLQEVSADWDEQLEHRGFYTRFPFNRRITGENPFGIAIVSRWPLRDMELFALAEIPAVRATIALGGRDVEIVSLHLMAPIDAEQSNDFWMGSERLVQSLGRRRGRPLILAGDFNASSDSLVAVRMREFVDDAWELAGPGFGATWPNGAFLAPPIRIDHIYVSHDLAVTSVATGEGAGSDHKPLVAEISFRP
jgi:endonuclease/exonuclease/phosphatase (EEP) superfamily protein YafD